jgi:hypothetical protein
VGSGHRNKRNLPATPACLPSINPPPSCVPTALDCDGNTRASGLYTEAEKRVEYIANLARRDGNIIYAIGLGEVNSSYRECGTPVLNIPFLQRVANDPSRPNYISGQPAGEVIIAPTAEELKQVFQTVAAKILLRLTR